jgi:hypothetical protein
MGSHAQEISQGREYLVVLGYAGGCALGPVDTAPPCFDEAARHVGHLLGRSAASQLLQPLLSALCERLLAILKRMPALTLAESQLRHQSPSTNLPQRLCDNFLAVVQGQAVVLVDALKVCSVLLGGHRSECPESLNGWPATCTDRISGCLTSRSDRKSEVLATS